MARNLAANAAGSGGGAQPRVGKSPEEETAAPPLCLPGDSGGGGSAPGQEGPLISPGVGKAP